MHSLAIITLFAALSAAVPHGITHLHLHERALRHRASALQPLAVRDAEMQNLIERRQNISPDGQCGSGTGFSCAAGFCCSQWGYCGQGAEYCGAGSGSSGTAAPSPTASQNATTTSLAPSGTASASASPTDSTPSSTPAETSAAPAPSSSGSSTGLGKAYTFYTGDGSSSQGWPAESSWMDFEALWAANEPTISASCTEFSETNNSPTENAELKSAIQSVGAASSVDPRFILAIVMQESKGCVRVDTTDNGVVNPGLMQSHDGTGTCNPGGPGAPGVIPCPANEITLMIEDGTKGTSSGAGLEGCYSQATGTSAAQKYYQAATIYNSGNLPANLDDNTATACYASDVANRLTGWTTAQTKCTLS